MLGLSPGEVTAALAGEFELASPSEVKETMRGFQSFLVKFEVGLFSPIRTPVSLIVLLHRKSSVLLGVLIIILDDFCFVCALLSLPKYLPSGPHVMGWHKDM